VGREQRAWRWSPALFSAIRAGQTGTAWVWSRFDLASDQPDDGASSTTVHLQLTIDDLPEAHRATWTWPFQYDFKITLQAPAPGRPASLSFASTVRNTGDEAFEFTAALHSYLAVSDVDDVTVRSAAFAGSSYIDKVDGGAIKSENRSAIKVDGQAYDRVYQGVTGAITLEDPAKPTLLVDSRGGWADTVLWTPYGNEGMGFRKFICVEAVRSTLPVSLAAGDKWKGTMSLSPPAKWLDPTRATVRHVVLLKLQAESTVEAKQEIIDGLRALPAVIPEILSYTVGPQLAAVDDGRNVDIAIVADFLTEVRHTNPPCCTSMMACLMFRVHAGGLRRVRCSPRARCGDQRQDSSCDRSGRPDRDAIHVMICEAVFA
jgi:hypothetical protein